MSLPLDLSGTEFQIFLACTFVTTSLHDMLFDDPVDVKHKTVWSKWTLDMFILLIHSYKTGNTSRHTVCGVE